MIGFNKLYATGNIGQTGSFKFNYMKATGSNFEINVQYGGNTNNSFQMSFPYIIYQ
jgi:hypothetical protein